MTEPETSDATVRTSVARELFGGMVATAIALVGFLPPLLHFATGPFGPFIGAFVVAQRLQPGARGCAIIGATLGAAFVGVGAAAAAAVGGLGSSSPPDWFPDGDVLGAIFAGVGAYAAGLGAAGATFGSRFGARRGGAV